MQRTVQRIALDARTDAVRAVAPSRNIWELIRAFAMTAFALLVLTISPALAATRSKKPIKAAPKVTRVPTQPIMVPPMPPMAPPVSMPMSVMPPAPPPPRPPLPPLVNPPGDAAQPLSNPGSWVSDTDYPPESKRLGEQGRVVARMAVDRKGMPYRCWIVSSSGSERLDATTCYLMQSRARFTPAHDPKGQAMEWTYQVAMRWTLQDEVEPSLPSRSASPQPTRRPSAARKATGVRKKIAARRR
jgi:protein TonB